MVKIYLAYDPERDFGYFLKDVYEYLFNRKKFKAMDKLEEMLEVCKTTEEKVSAIRQFVVLVEVESYRRSIEKIEQEVREKKKLLVLRTISENPGIEKDEIDLVSNLDYVDVTEALISLKNDKLIKTGFVMMRNGKSMVLYENTENYKDIEEYNIGWATEFRK